MKFNLCILLTIAVILFSCKERTMEKPLAADQNPTPELLDNSEDKISSMSKRYRSDMIQDLFNEACEKDKNLKELTEKMNAIGEMQNDSLKQYNEFIQNNKLYWSDAKRYINQLNDSSLKNDLKKIFETLETKYSNSIAEHNKAVETIEKRELAMNDCMIIMKLSVTLPMINSYQKNELPVLKTLNDLIFRYDSLIHETKPYTTLIK